MEEAKMTAILASSRCQLCSLGAGFALTFKFSKYYVYRLKYLFFQVSQVQCAKNLLFQNPVSSIKIQGFSLFEMLGISKICGSIVLCKLRQRSYISWRIITFIFFFDFHMSQTLLNASIKLVYNQYYIYKDLSNVQWETRDFCSEWVLQQLTDNLCKKWNVLLTIPIYATSEK